METNSTQQIRFNCLSETNRNKINVSVKRVFNTLQRCSLILILVFAIHEISKAQVPVTTYITTAQTNTASVITGAPGYCVAGGSNSFYNSSLTYNATFGTLYPATSATINKIVGFTQGGNTYTPISAGASTPFSLVTCNRVNNVAYSGNRFSGFFQYTSVRDGSGVENYNVQANTGLTAYISPTAKYTMPEVINNFSLAYGADNLFSNYGLGNIGFQGTNTNEQKYSTGNNIERIDLIYQPGIGATTTTGLQQVGFLVNERGGNDIFKVAVITGVDGSGNVTSLGSVISVTSSSWGQVGPQISTAVFMGQEGSATTIFPKELVGMAAYTTGPIATQPVSGIYFTLASLGVPVNTKVYGLAIFPGDITTNFLTLSGTPTNTPDAGNGGLDLMSGNMIARATNNFDIFGQTLSGKVWNDLDNDGVDDGASEQNVSGTNTSASGSVAANSNLYVNVVDASTGNVIAVVQVQADGTYSYNGVLPSFDYKLVVTTSPGTVGSPVPSSTIPANWVHTKDNQDGVVDPLTTGELTFTSPFGADVVNQNFGIQQPPTAVSNTVPSQVNPGGTTSVVVPSSDFEGNDLNGGTVVNVKITTFPTNATSITINGVTYTTGTFPLGGVTIPTDINGNPTQTISIDPIDGAVTSVITYTATDNGGAVSSPATVTVPFTTVNVSGNVFNDPNGGNVNNSTGTFNEVPAGMYANLVDAGGNVVAATTVNTDGTYSFTGINGGNYTVVLSTTQGTVGSSVPAASLPTGWVNTGEFNGAPGTGNTAPINGISASFTVSTVNVSDINFGIEQPPIADAKAQQVPYPSGGSVPAGAIIQIISGTDPVLGGTHVTLNSTNTIVITSVPANATMLYDFDGAGGNPPTVVTVGTSITGFNPANLSYSGITNGSVSVVFNYAFVDAAGVTGSSASYTVTWIGGPLPIKLVGFSGKAFGCNTAELRWTVENAENFSGFVVERREGTAGFKGVSFLNYKAGQSTYMLQDALSGDGVYQYRLKLEDVDGKYEYSPVISVALNCGNKGIRMYPTATRTSSKIYGLTPNQQIKIVSATGQLMESKRVKSNVEEVDLSNYPSGLFFIIIREESNSQVFYGKLIKL